LFMSGALGFASGVLLATITFEMLPKALELGALLVASGGFIVGFVMVYAFDLFIHRGVLAGEKAEQRPQVERFYQRHHPRGGEVTVLAGGTSAEELIEGLSIGVGAAIDPGLGVLIAFAIVIDNFSEGLSIGEIIRNEKGERSQAARILGWTGLIGAAVLVSTLAGWFLLRGMSQPVLGFLFGVGAGGMFYLTVTDLVPEAEERQYQQIAAVAMGVGFMLLFALSTVL
jgi:zinc transporter, ZIP family